MSSSEIVYYNKDCLFCKIISKEIPSYELIETKYSFSFLDINPTAKGHILIIPKYHGQHLQDISDQYLTDILPIAKRFAQILNMEITSDGAVTEKDGEPIGFNLLQNNGKIAGQVVNHVHFHFIPKRDTKTGISIGWPSRDASEKELKDLQEQIRHKLTHSTI